MGSYLFGVHGGLGLLGLIVFFKRVYGASGALIGFMGFGV